MAKDKIRKYEFKSIIKSDKKADISASIYQDKKDKNK